jgi:hypothetical protein
MHGLRLKGLAEPSGVTEVTAIPEADVKSILDQLVVEDLASYRDGRLSGFALTPTGRGLHATLLTTELDGFEARVEVQSAYDRFLGLNIDLLTICTDWQLRPVEGQSTVNDHLDAAYDRAVIDQLEDLHGRALPICDDLTAALGRFARYGQRLAHAVERVRAGDKDWFTRPTVASYHSVWFELHEDLLCTLGIERATEGAE